MKINKCPKCGRKPIIMPWTQHSLSISSTEDISLKEKRYQVECEDCGLYTRCCKERTEAIEMWNRMTKEIINETIKA